MTLLVEVDPVQKLSDVRAELLQAIHDTNPSGELNGLAIPKNPDDIILGRAIERNNLTLGFISITSDLEGGEAQGKGKTAASSATKSVTGFLKDSPQGAGLRTGDVVAFKFKDNGEGKGEEDELAEKWDVVIPTMEETYGDEDEGIGSEEG